MDGNLSNLSITDTDWKAVEKVAWDLQTYYLWVILALGFPGNCATIVTVLKMSPARSLTVYIALLAVVDNLAILNKLLMFVLLDHRVNIGHFGCKFMGYLGNVLITFANWLLVAMSVERFAAVWFPFKVGQIWTFKKSLVAVILLAVPFCALFLHLFWVMEVVEEDGQIFCDALPQFQEFMKIWFWVNIVIYAALPCVLLLVFNLLIVGGIIRAGKVQKYLNSSMSSNNGHACGDRHRQITIMLVTAAVTLVVFTTPRCVMMVLSFYWRPPLESMEGAVKYLIDTIAFFLCDLTHAVNFYVYSLSAKKFRNQFIDLMVCGRRRRKMTPSHTQYVSMSSRPSVRIKLTTLD